MTYTARKTLLTLAMMIAVLLTLFAVNAFAQDVPTAIDVLVLPSVSETPVANRVTAISPTSALCDRDPSPPTQATFLVNPTRVEFDDPFHAGRQCRVSLPTGLPDDVGYRARAEFMFATCTIDDVPQTNCRSARSDVASPMFHVGTDPGDMCGGAVSLVVGDWQRTVMASANGRVTYSLLGSRNAVTTLILRFNGVEQDRLTGSDLRKVAGSYFRVPSVRGSYLLSVEALAGECSDGATRPMTVIVQ